MSTIYFVTVILMDTSEFIPLENCGRYSRCKYDRRPTVWLKIRNHELITKS